MEEDSLKTDDPGISSVMRISLMATGLAVGIAAGSVSVSAQTYSRFAGEMDGRATVVVVTELSSPLLDSATLENVALTLHPLLAAPGAGDTMRVMYFTPRLGGFRFGGAWTAGDGETGDDPANRFAAPPEIVSPRADALDFGAVYTGEFVGIGLEAQGGVQITDAPAYRPGRPAIASDDDYFGYSGGLALSYRGFRAAGSFSVGERSPSFECSTPDCRKTYAIRTESASFRFGVGFERGPWGVSATYFNGEEQGPLAASGYEESRALALVGSYDLGSGFRTSLTFMHANLETGAADGAPCNTGSACAEDAFNSFMWGLRLGF